MLTKFFERAAAGQLRWCGTQFPCQSSAQDAEMSLAAYEDFVFQAGLLASRRPGGFVAARERRQQRLADYLNGKKEIRFIAPNGTDLKLAVEGRRWINCDGHENFPTARSSPDRSRDAVEGDDSLQLSGRARGRECDGIRFTFRGGGKWSRPRDEGVEFLIAMLDQDSRRSRAGRDCHRHQSM